MIAAGVSPVTGCDAPSCQRPALVAGEVWSEVMNGLLVKLLGDHYGYKPSHRMLEVLGIIGFFLIEAIILRQIIISAGLLDSIHLTWIFGVSLILAYIAADFASGFVHWLGDTFGAEDWPVLGAAFIMPFRQHHVDPKGITRHDFIEVNGNNCIVLMLYLVPFYLAVMPFLSHNLFGLLFSAFNMFFAFGIFMTNQFHKWAHAANPPAIAKRLQAVGLILTPENHNVHHTAPHKTYFCITSGWLNPIIDRIDLWTYLERGMGYFTGHDYSNGPVHPSPAKPPEPEHAG